MVKYLLFVIAFLVINPFSILGQKRSVLLNGVVMDAETHIPITNAHFINSAGHSGITNEAGQFATLINSGDTIIFSVIGYSTMVYHVPDSLMAREYLAGIFLYTDTIAVGEVIINPRIGNLKAEILKYEPSTEESVVNARNNISVSVYQGLAGANELGDPLTNYELLRQQQKTQAYERGGIPSDRMVGFNPITFIPGLIYMMVNGLPEKYEPPAPRVTNIDLERLKMLHNQYLGKQDSIKK